MPRQDEMEAFKEEHIEGKSSNELRDSLQTKKWAPWKKEVIEDAIERGKDQIKVEGLDEAKKANKIAKEASNMAKWSMGIAASAIVISIFVAIFK